MTSVEEFVFIAAQLAWLEAQLRAQSAGSQGGRMESALNALVCARAVISELGYIGRSSERPPTATPCLTPPRIPAGSATANASPPL